MNCCNCGDRLRPHQFAQPVRTAIGEVTPPSACDQCCHASLTLPGSREALERLVTGRVDQERAAEVAKIVASWS